MDEKGQNFREVEPKNATYVAYFLLAILAREEFFLELQ